MSGTSASAAHAPSEEEARLTAALNGEAVPASTSKVSSEDKSAVTAPSSSTSSVSLTGSPRTGPLKQDTSASNISKDREHQLETPWTFYSYTKPKERSKGDFNVFEQNLLKLGQCTSVEGFWKYYANLQVPDRMSNDNDIYLFRHNQLPAWETFPAGGCWIVKVRKRNGLINRLWEELAFACISEQFEEPHLVGVVLSIRQREDCLSIWNRDNVRYPEVRFKIGERLKEILNLDDSTQVEYKHFSMSIVDGSTYRNAKAYVFGGKGGHGRGQSEDTAAAGSKQADAHAADADKP